MLLFTPSLLRLFWPFIFFLKALGYVIDLSRPSIVLFSLPLFCVIRFLFFAPFSRNNPHLRDCCTWYEWINANPFLISFFLRAPLKYVLFNPKRTRLLQTKPAVRKLQQPSLAGFGRFYTWNRYLQVDPVKNQNTELTRGHWLLLDNGSPLIRPCFHRKGISLFLRDRLQRLPYVRPNLGTFGQTTDIIKTSRGKHREGSGVTQIRNIYLRPRTCRTSWTKFR